MELIPNFLEKQRPEGEISDVRKRQIKKQIKMFNNQLDSVSKIHPESTKELIGITVFSELLTGFISRYKMELSDYYDTSEEYNS